MSDARPFGPWLGLVLAITGASLGIVAKYAGVAGVAACAAAYAAALWIALQRPLAVFVARTSEPSARWLAIATLAALGLLFVVAYPLLSSGGFSTSDSDEALELAARELLAGGYPYYARTSLDNPISPLPGSLLLALPFVLLGCGALQNFFWLVVFTVQLRRHLVSWAWVLPLLWILASTPAFLHKYVTGYDYVANSLFVLLFAWWLIDATKSRRMPLAALTAMGLGIALSSRANFLPLLPLVLSRLWQLAGGGAATGLIALAGVTFAAITMPFYLYDPAGFSPLHTSNKLDQFRDLLPHAGLVVGGATGLLAITLSRPRWNAGPIAFFRNCALVQATPIACGLGLGVWKWGAGVLRSDLAFFGDFYLYFAALAAWLAIHARSQRGDGGAASARRGARPPSA